MSAEEKGTPIKRARLITAFFSKSNTGAQSSSTAENIGDTTQVVAIQVCSVEEGLPQSVESAHSEEGFPQPVEHAHSVEEGVPQASSSSSYVIKDYNGTMIGAKTDIVSLHQNVTSLDSDIGQVFLDNKRAFNLVYGLSDFSKRKLLTNHWMPDKNFQYPCTTKTSKRSKKGTQSVFLSLKHISGDTLNYVRRSYFFEKD